jgi:hypothetical protein
LPTLVFPGSATTAVTFFVGTIINGLMAKGIAAYWRQENGAGVSKMNEAERHNAQRKENVGDCRNL